MVAIVFSIRKGLNLAKINFIVKQKMNKFCFYQYKYLYKTQLCLDYSNVINNNKEFNLPDNAIYYLINFFPIKCYYFYLKIDKK